MHLLLAFTLTAALVVTVVLIHYEVLLAASRLGRHLSPPRRRILVVIGAAFLAHLVEIALFAAGYYVMDMLPGIFGTIEGLKDGDPVEYLYFSMTMYTTLGIGDLSPSGALRIPAGIESLIGLVLITWTASFSYLVMERYWSDR
jgi:hypothetical protein